MDEKYLNEKTIKTSIAQLAAFKQMGFTMSEVLLLLVILSLLDGANCLIINANSMADFFNISERHIYRTLHKTKEFGVVKNGKRYDFTALKETLDNLGKVE